MSVQVENLEKNMAKLTIEVPAEELEKALEKAYQKQKKNISVPGFRKGKVPRAMVEKMYGPAVFYEDAVNSLVPEEYSKAAEESKLDIEKSMADRIMVRLRPSLSLKIPAKSTPTMEHINAQPTYHPDDMVSKLN